MNIWKRIFGGAAIDEGEPSTHGPCPPHDTMPNINMWPSNALEEGPRWGSAMA